MATHGNDPRPARDPVRPPSLPLLWIGGMVLFQLLYTAIFASFWPRMSLIEAAEAAATNVVPLGLLTLVVRAILKTYLMPLGVVAQGLLHALLAPAFAVA